MPHTLYGTVGSRMSGTRLLNLQDKSEFQISAPRIPLTVLCWQMGVLDIVVHRNVRISYVNVLEILETDHLPTLLKHARSC